ncbi:MAG: hypothetical protein HC903_08310 [Methylacidiphilales bacterium]|nr:hypothetical protein [Candidatus Methylacidiphilales bacterium]
MTIYCEGALKAEVTFSLTGGREGKIISDRPPVNVVFPAIGNLIQIKTNYFGGGGLDRILYEDSTDASDDANWESLETVIFSMFLLNNSSLEFPSLNYAVFPVESGFLFRTALFLNTNGSLTSLWDNNYKSGDYIRSYTVKVSKKKKYF